MPGNECLNEERTHQHIGDLIVNLIEILPVRFFRFEYKKDFLFDRNMKIMWKIMIVY
jgi:hypothetical protein